MRTIKTTPRASCFVRILDAGAPSFPSHRRNHMAFDDELDDAPGQVGKCAEHEKVKSTSATQSMKTTVERASQEHAQASRSGTDRAWCTVSMEERFDGKPMPGVVHGVHEYRVESSKNASISTHRAVRLLGLKEAMIFPVSNGGPTLTTRTDGEMMEMARKLTNPPRLDRVARIKDLGHHIPASTRLDERLHDIMEKKSEVGRGERTKMKTLTWFDGDVYLWKQPRSSTPGLIDRIFIRIDCSTGERVPFLNCGSNGDELPGTSQRQLRSALAASKKIERDRREMTELREMWKKYVKGQNKCIPEFETASGYVLIHGAKASKKKSDLKQKKDQRQVMMPSTGTSQVVVKRERDSEPARNAGKRVKKVKEAEKIENRKSNDKLKPKPKKSTRKQAAPISIPWGGEDAPRVIVIGAGPAGLSAARSLKDHGVNVVVLESRNRPGGRCHTYEMPALPVYGLPSVQVDLGASFVHGCHEYNPLFVIAKSNKVTLNNAGGGYSAGWSENAAWYNASDGGRVKPATVTHAFKMARKATNLMFGSESNDEMSSLYEPSKSNTDVLGPAAFNVSLVPRRPIDGMTREDCSLHEAFRYATEITMRSLLNGNKRFEVLKPVYDSIPTITWAYVAPMTAISFNEARASNNEVLEATERLRNQSVEDSYNEEESDHGEEESLVPVSDAKGEKMLDLSDGMVVDGYKNLLIDRLVGAEDDCLDIRYQRAVTHVKVDEDKRINVHGLVENKKQDVLYVVTCSNGEKFECQYVVVTVPLGVLKKRCITFEPNLSVDKQKAISRLGMGTENKVYMRFAEKFWPKARFMQCTDARYRFLNVDAYGKKNTLLVHVSPPYARDFDGKSDREIVLDVCHVLKTMFRLKETPQPVDSKVTRWGQDEHSYGAYSYMHVGSCTDDVKALVATEHNGRVYFAGEACSVEAAQCVHGAVLTGNAAAVEILSIGNVDIDETKIVGGAVGLQLEDDDNVRWETCSKCDTSRRIPACATIRRPWECRDGGAWNTYMGKHGCSYKDER